MRSENAFMKMRHLYKVLTKMRGGKYLGKEKEIASAKSPEVEVSCHV